VLTIRGAAAHCPRNEGGPHPESGWGPLVVRSIDCAPRYRLVTPGSSRSTPWPRSRTSGARVCEDPRTINEGRVRPHVFPRSGRAVFAYPTSWVQFAGLSARCSPRRAASILRSAPLYSISRAGRHIHRSAPTRGICRLSQTCKPGCGERLRPGQLRAPSASAREHARAGGAQRAWPHSH